MLVEESFEWLNSLIQQTIRKSVALHDSIVAAEEMQLKYQGTEPSSSASIYNINNSNISNETEPVFNTYQASSGIIQRPTTIHPKFQTDSDHLSMISKLNRNTSDNRMSESTLTLIPQSYQDRILQYRYDDNTKTIQTNQSADSVSHLKSCACIKCHPIFPNHDYSMEIIL